MNPRAHDPHGFPDTPAPEADPPEHGDQHGAAEELTAREEAELEDRDHELAERLRSLLDPSADLRDRTTADVDRTLRGRSVLASGFELLGLGVWTVSALLSDPPSPADEHREGS